MNTKKFFVAVLLLVTLLVLGQLVAVNLLPQNVEASGPPHETQPCPGKSCDPLPTQAQACNGPAGEPGRNPHCQPPTEEPTQVPPTQVSPTLIPPVTITSVPPTATPVPTQESKPKKLSLATPVATTKALVCGEGCLFVDFVIDEQSDMEWAVSSLKELEAAGYACPACVRVRVVFDDPTDLQWVPEALKALENAGYKCEVSSQ